MPLPLFSRLAAELSVRPAQIEATVKLMDDGATVPFIARYRKEATGGLTDTQLRTLDERLRYLRELEDRRAVVIQSIREQGKLTPELEAALVAADTKVRLEDLYLPYRPKRRTKAAIAREAGLEPLADALWHDANLVPDVEAARYVNPEAGITDAAAALEGAKWILMERIAEDAAMLGELREWMWAHVQWRSTVIDGSQEKGQKFADYFDASEPLRSVPSHRALAMFRGRREGILRLRLMLVDDLEGASVPGGSVPEQRVAARVGFVERGRPADPFLRDVVAAAWKVKIRAHLEDELESRVRDAAELEALRVFARNLRDLLLAAPAGPRTTIGLDPGLRTGVKVAVVDATGKLVETTTIYPHPPRNDREGALAVLAAIAARHKAELVAIGNGTASRETESLVTDLLRRYPNVRLERVVVSEAGASVYSASERASLEFPDLDVSLRGAVSIARRLQDPLAELVKIDPKAIGVGQYQHDVSQPQLAHALDGVVEDCVNAVGADVNTASVPLLARISGLNQRLAANIVAWRDEHGRFRSRRELSDVPRFGEKTFELAAGFLRIIGGENPLDASAVHPEAYPVVERISAKTGRPIAQLIGNAAFLRGLDVAPLVDARFGEPTIRDILAELEKPGRDPRPEFRTATFRDGVHAIGDLQPGMRLEGVVTNVANFGAFVDIGVHQDGLVHVSQLADRFVKDPREVVKAGDVVKVTVVDVDVKRARIGLTMRMQPAPAAKAPTPNVAQTHEVASKPKAPTPAGGRRKPEALLEARPPKAAPAATQTALGAAFAKLRRD